MMQGAQQASRHARARASFAGAGAVARHEWRLRLASPLTLVFQAGFLLALAALIFLVADFYASDETSPRPLMTFLPWVAMILVPALAMRAFADDGGDRGLELLRALPVATPAIVLGKHLAGVGVLLVTLVGTLPFILTLAYLGAPDWGVVAGTVLGAALLLVAFHAVALLAAALAREPVAAFVTGVLALLALLLAGTDLPLRQTSPVAAMLIDGVALVSPRTAAERIAAGRVDAASVLVPLLLAAIALAAAVRVIDARGGQPAGLRGAARRVLAVIAGVTSLAVAAGGLGRLPLILDLTSAREHTLSPGLKTIAARVPDGTVATLYWNRSDASIPASIRGHARRVEDLLAAAAQASRGRLRVAVRDPAPDTEAEVDAGAAGIRRVPMSLGGAFHLGATVAHGERTSRIAYFDPRRDGLAEYDVARALAGLARQRTPKVALLSPLIAPTQLEAGRPGLSVINELKRTYDVAVVPHFAAALPEGLDVLIVIDATILRREMLYAIDQHVMRGGGLIVLLDPRLNASQAADRVRPKPGPEIDDISDLLLAWGLAYHPGDVVGDEAFAAPVLDSRQRRISMPFWLRIAEDGLARAHPATASLSELLLVEPGSFTIEKPGQTTALVTTSARSGVLPAETIAGAPPDALAGAFRSDGQRRTLAAALAAPFASAFKAVPDGQPRERHQAASTGRPTVIAVADADWIFDDFALQTVDAGGASTSRPLNDNLTLLFNLIDHAGGDPDLISIRSRGRLARPFTRVGQLLSDGQARHRDEEREIAGRIGRVEGQIAQVLAAAGVQRAEQLPDGIQARLQQLQRDLAPHRKRLREIRLSMREEVERLGVRLTAVNLVAGPLLMAAITGLLRYRRRLRLTAIKAAADRP